MGSTGPTLHREEEEEAEEEEVVEEAEEEVEEDASANAAHQKRAGSHWHSDNRRGPIK